MVVSRRAFSSAPASSPRLGSVMSPSTIVNLPGSTPVSPAMSAASARAAARKAGWAQENKPRAFSSQTLHQTSGDESRKPGNKDCFIESHFIEGPEFFVPFLLTIPFLPLSISSELTSSDI